MSLSQTARSQFNTRQKNRLILCLGAAIGAHGLLFAGWSLQQRENRQAQQKDPIGVEFVYLDPSARASRETESSRRAQVDSVAGGTRNENLPTSAGKTSQNAAPQPTPDRPTPPIPPQSASQPIAANPSPAPAPPSPSPALQPTAAERTERTPQRTTPQRTTPQRAITERTTVRSPIQPAPSQTATAPRPPRPAAPAAPPTNPQSGQGLDGQINPDRMVTGTASLDASADEVWGLYVSTLNQKIDQNWQRITVSATRQAKVQFEIDRQGRLVNLNLTQPSGDASADTAALQAVRLAAPFTPFPAQTTESRLRVNFTFTYYPADHSPASQSPNSLQPLTPAQ